MRLNQWYTWIFMFSLFSFMVSWTGVPGSTLNYLVTANGISIELSPEGKIIRVTNGKNNAGKPLQAFTRIAGCRQLGKTTVQKNKSGVLQFSKVLINDSLHQSCVLIENCR